jgi:two-component system, NarL family, invasion response regulator UvrY
MTVRVLVADDQAPFRKAARSVLSAMADFQLVGEASSGEEAVTLVESLRPDLVLMDIKMDGIGGIAAARSITATFPRTVTVLVSTYREEDLPLEARMCGARYLHKSDLDGRVLSELWKATGPLRDRGQQPSPACEPRSPMPDQA